MSSDLSERRLAENEVIFRELNQKVVRGLTELKELALSHNEDALAPDTTQTLLFYCECANLDCSKRIAISPEEYENIHKNPRHFITAKNHQIPEIEKVVKSTPEYDVVEKNVDLSPVVSE